MPILCICEQGWPLVLKFFKYQRFKPQEWLRYLTFLPGMEKYRQRKIEKKKNKLEGVFTSWRIAYEELRPETGVLYVHLNKSDDLPKAFKIYDKMGWGSISRPGPV